MKYVETLKQGYDQKFLWISQPLHDADDKVTLPNSIQTHRKIHQRQLIFSDLPSTEAGIKPGSLD